MNITVFKKCSFHFMIMFNMIPSNRYISTNIILYFLYKDQSDKFQMLYNH